MASTWKRIAALLIAMGTACTGQDARSPARDSTAGDTSMVYSQAIAPVVRIDTVQVIWQSPELERPRSMDMIQSKLVIADPMRIHVVDTASGFLQTVGRDGEGPGEFRSISAVAARGDSILVHDARLLRLSVFNLDLQFVDSHVMTPASPFVNPRRPLDILRVHHHGLLVVRRENVRLDQPTRSALLFHDPVSDSSVVLQTWDDLHYTNLPGDFMGPARILGPTAMVAVARDATEVASGDGIEYCITVQRIEILVLQPVAEKLCREWRSVAVGNGIRHPDFSPIQDPELRSALEATIAVQEVPDRLPAFDDLRYDAEGRLWVRTIGSELSNLHPVLMGRIPDLRPEYRRWDIFDRDRRLSQTIELPSRFDPQILLHDRAYGFYELESGEIVIGMVAVAPASVSR